MSKKWIALVLLTLGTNCACAASFDCSKASTKVEKMICADAELSKLDEKLNDRYLQARKKYPELKSLKTDQREWLARRDKCISAPRPVICINTSYKSRVSELDPYSVRYTLPVRIKDLGRNWQFKSEAEKLPIIREAMASGRLKNPPPTYNTEEFCKTFPEDLITGRNIEVIEPDMKIMERNDPRLGHGRYEDVNGKRVWGPRDAPGVGKWLSCDHMDYIDSTAKDPGDLFTWFDLQGLLPYYIYQVELDGNAGNGPEDVLMFREAHNGYSHDYYWVDLNGCEIKQKIQVNSPAHWLRPGHKDAVSFMIRYQGIPMVVRYVDWAKKSDSEKEDKISINSMANPRQGCTWSDPVGIIWKSYGRSLESGKSGK